MVVLPVIDLKGGHVVLGHAGQRESYRSVQSRLCESASPAEVACAFARLGFSQAYLADLDAIGDAEPDWASYERIADHLESLWIDAGIADVDRAADILRWAAGRDIRLICGLESLVSSHALQQMLAQVGSQQLVVSLDLFNGQVHSQVRDWVGSPPLKVARHLIQIGVRSLIVLDIARVGTNTGTGTRQLCRAIRGCDDRVQIICGGGVATVQDVLDLCHDGCQFVLVASALHDGRIGRAQLRELSTSSYLHRAERF